MIAREVFINNQLMLFIRGIKPGAFYLDSEEKSLQLKEKNYPYIQVFGNKCLFFQNKKSDAGFHG